MQLMGLALTNIGQEWSNTYRGRFGAYWANGVPCGSRGSGFEIAPLELNFSHIGARDNLVTETA